MKIAALISSLSIVFLPSVLLALSFPVFIGMFAGILRATFGFSFDRASFFALIPSLLALLVVYKLPRPKWYVFFIATIFLFFLIERNFFSLATLGNADSGLHLQRLIDFAHKNPHEYHGFVSYYASVEVLHRYFSFNYLWAMALPLYVAAFVLFVHMGTGKQVDEPWLVYIFRSGLALSVALTIVFQFMGQGAFAHVWAMPISLVIFRLATWHGIAELPRFIGLGAAIVILRYSYGLNLADHILFVATAMFFSPLSAKIRVPLALGILAVAVIAYVNIWDVLRLGGAKTKISLGLVWLGLSASALAALLFLTKQDGRKMQWILIAVLSVLTVCVQILYWQTGGRLLYYGMKYPMCAILVVCAGFASISWHRNGHFNEHRQVGHTCVIAALLLYFLVFPLRPYLGQMLWSEYREPLIKSKTYSALENHLQREGKQFGGYLTPNWPAAKFVGAAFHFRQSTGYKLGTLKEEKDHCVFWESSPGRFLEMQRVMHIVHGQADKVMSTYRRLYSTQSLDYTVGMLADGELAYLCR